MNAHAEGGQRARLPLVDALKAIASQLIVLHHLAFYGPMSDYAQSFCPELTAWLSQNGRIAVQAFLVMGGFLSAQSLARDGRLSTKPVGTLLWHRYLKLVPPYLGALLLAIVCSAIARNLISHGSIPGTPTLSQLVAHIFLLQSILGFDSLSAGVWYIAIDFQLYVLLLLTLVLARRFFPQSPRAGLSLIIILMTASLFYFNRESSWDNWAFYFFGAYGLGAITYWTVQRQRVSVGLLLIVGLVLAALLLDFRSRIAVALLVAIALGLARYTGRIECWPKSKILVWLGQISYSVFLVNFPICLVINSLFERFVPHSPALQMAGILIAWLASIGCGALCHQHVECRTQGLLRVKP